MMRNFSRSYFAISNSLVFQRPLASVLFRSVGLQKNDASFGGTMAEVKEKIMTSLGLEEGYEPIPKTREHLMKYLPKAENLPPRSMQDSFTSAIIPLSTDKQLQDKYVAFLGHVRLGRLMEDMDLFAVWVCHQHLKIPDLPKSVHLPYTFVTVLADKITFSDIRTNITEDIRLSGHISWVGRSSMEVVVWLEQKDHGIYKKITRALFLFAARNATNTSSAPVNAISPASDEERNILLGGEKRKQNRQKIQAESIFKVEPNDFEQTIMYDLYKRTTPLNTMELNVRVLPGNCRWMSKSFIVSTIPCFPENRNAHYKVFGGFIMRNALEISWAAARLYNKSPAKLKHICDISFEKPVSVSSFIKMSAYVVYTQANYIQVMTVADVLDAASGEQVTSNVFYYTFTTPSTVPEVLPQSYQETMWYIQGRRKFRYSLGLDAQNNL
ncbi:acyl-coenzyme A thioesterase 9, mitochondrial-like [Teleopsis dalmanni]|uniref:acyl-coenzyme A thioesterase 9, mitochondrial-like n=1 Tax=Teleopsis dalmanni TaxID=139649 RepID=UPI0018CE5AEB|nr:acyl-coenzyme A thioesterase 9, mitochondrial-like [Teleopsis dalmanni]